MTLKQIVKTKNLEILRKIALSKTFAILMLRLYFQSRKVEDFLLQKTLKLTLFYLPKEPLPKLKLILHIKLKDCPPFHLLIKDISISRTNVVKFSNSKESNPSEWTSFTTRLQKKEPLIRTFLSLIGISILKLRTWPLSK